MITRSLLGLVGLLFLLAALAGTGCDGAANSVDGGLDAGLDATTEDGGEDGSGDDAYHPLRVGSEETFEAVTWNLHNFPSEQSSAGHVSSLIIALDLDLVAVQEIADERAFADMLSYLPSHDAALSPHVYNQYEYQKVGFVYRKDLLAISQVTTLFNGETYAFPRPPLQAHFSCLSPKGCPGDFVAIVIHLKASPGEDNEARRRAACRDLKTHIDALLAEGTEQVILLGDFNDLLDDDPTDNIYTVFLDDTDNYRFLSQELADRGDYSYIPYPSLLDHVLITQGLTAEYGLGQTRVLALDKMDLGFDYEDLVSDHRPVISIFSD
ncbi:MAG: endonuclease/exonuclease/phosphatase family protein [Deltaproteobacteria bacterium]|nr:endonuclease/exonuclease/phosphatase family protein [Deltaproteobacteria bacterium]